MKKIRVLLVDDHTLVRQGLRQLLEVEPDIEVVGEAADGAEVSARVAETRPDVILMDINMPVVDGVAATRQVLADFPDVGIIILTMYRQDQFVFEAVRAGARGYLLKNAKSSELVNAIRAVAAGAALIDPVIAGNLLKEFQRLAPASGASPGSRLEQLTERETEILRLVATGASNKAIANAVCLSEKTVKNYLSTIFKKLQINDRVQAATYAVRQGITSSPNNTSF
ncbi:MAG: response regulator transcription factor [Dehalococcoidia bacterium]|nr:response regulator transcription factor [Dehalococcoidia bacterium]